MDHDHHIPMKPEQWNKTQKWIINRILFLMHLQDKNSERFYGGDLDAFEQMENELLLFQVSKDSFSPELRELHKRHQTLFAKTNAIFMNDFPSEKVTYI